MTVHIAALMQLGAKEESTEGTYSQPVAADTKLIVRSATYTPVMSKVDREGRSSSLSPHPMVGTAIGGTVSFELDLYSAGQSAVPAWAVLAKCCGLANVAGGTSAAWTFDLYSLQDAGGTSIPTCSLSFNVNGYAHRLAGCRGNMEIKATAGGPWTATFTFLGKHEAPADDAFETYSADTNSLFMPSFINASVAMTAVSAGADALSATEAKLEGMNINLNNQLFLRPSANDSTGFDFCAIVGRLPKLTIDPEWLTVADFDAITGLASDHVYNFTTGQCVGEGTDNNIQIDIPKAQLIGVSRQERGGAAVMALELLCTRTTGDDEITLTIAA